MAAILMCFEKISEIGSSVLSGGVAGAIAGGVMGAIMTNWLTVKRERQNRQREFRGWLKGFEAEIDSIGQMHVVAKKWTDTKREFLAKADGVRDTVSFWKRGAYDKAVADLANLKAREVDAMTPLEKGGQELTGKDKLSELLGRVIRTVG